MCYWLEALFSGPSLSLVVLFFFFLWLFFFLLVGILYIGSSTQIVFFFLILKLSFFLLLVFESVAKRHLLSNLIDYCTVTCCVFNVLAHITPRYMLERKLTWFLFHDSDSTWRPYFPLFFLCLTYRLSKRGRGRWRAICSCPFFFSCYACYLFVALFCVFRLLFLPEWEHNDKAILCACFLFFFFLKSSVALVYVFTTSVAKRYPTTGPLLSFLLLFCYMCLLMWVFALVMRVFFFSWTWVLLKIMKERRDRKSVV